ncbi:MAG TPA: DUF2125 domain-containing protein [Rhizomicrobium sp.]|nr:DUF2125 domain-containing protein [Rhizomicrobium sp.]
MSFSHRFFLYGPFGLFVALAASVMIYWWHAADQLAHRLDQMNGHEIAPGVHMHFRTKRIAGFPFRLDAIFTDFSVDAPGADGPITWRAHDFASHRLTYDSTKYVLEAAGPQVIAWTNDHGQAKSFRFTPAALHGSAILEGGKLVRFDIDTFGLASEKFSAARAQFHLRHDPVLDALDLVADLQNVRFAGDAAAGFGDGFSHARIEGRLAPAEPFAPVLAGGADWRHALDVWQHGKDSGFKVDQAALFWGKCEATSSGAVTLDSEHRLAGSLAFSLADCASLDKQAASISEHPGSHRALLDVLADLSHRVPEDKSGALPITVVFKDGLIFVGPGKDVGGNVGFEPVGFLHALY